MVIFIVNNINAILNLNKNKLIWDTDSKNTNFRDDECSSSLLYVKYKICSFTNTYVSTYTSQHFGYILMNKADTRRDFNLVYNHMVYMNITFKIVDNAIKKDVAKRTSLDY